MKSQHKLQSTTHHIQRQQSKLEEMEKQDVVNLYIYSMLPQTPVFFMNAKQTKTGTKQKQNKKHA